MQTIKINKSRRFFEIHPPSSHNTSPNKPSIVQKDHDILKDVVDIIIQDNDFCNDPDIMKKYKLHQHEQGANYSLNQLPCSFLFLKDAINQDFNNFLSFIWNYKVNREISTYDNQMLNIMKYVLTDFHVNCQLPLLPSSSNERTSFCQLVIPIFKSFSAVTKLISFTW